MGRTRKTIATTETSCPWSAVALLRGGSRGAAALVFEVEADGKLEVELDGGALVDALHGVHDLDVNLGAVERAVSWVHAPVALARELVHRLRQSLLRLTNGRQGVRFIQKIKLNRKFGRYVDSTSLLDPHLGLFHSLIH